MCLVYRIFKTHIGFGRKDLWIEKFYYALAIILQLVLCKTLIVADGICYALEIMTAILPTMVLGVAIAMISKTLYLYESTYLISYILTWVFIIKSNIIGLYPIYLWQGHVHALVIESRGECAGLHAGLWSHLRFCGEWNIRTLFCSYTSWPYGITKKWIKRNMRYYVICILNYLSNLTGSVIGYTRGALFRHAIC